MSTILEIKQLSVAFQTNNSTLTAVDAANFSLNTGETLALLGESGCGKSLTALALMRLLPPFGAYGHQSVVALEGQDILELPEYLMRQLRGRRIALIFQDPMTALNPVMTIGKQLKEALNTKNTDQRSIKQRILTLLHDVEMPDPELHLQQYPHQLSGGQRQRVVIAMALASRPDVLIADEPTSALDVTIQAQILHLLKKLQRQYHMSILLITHDLAVVKAIADRVCVMYAGQIIEYSPIDAFFSQPLHPYVQKMLLALPSLVKRTHWLTAIKGHVPTLDAMPSGCRFHPRCAHAFALCQQQEPELQSFDQERSIRCHLYPSHTYLPHLANDEQKLPTKNNNPPCRIMSVKNLSVHFKKPTSLFKCSEPVTRSVDDLSFDLYQGKTVALVGESGCGKTTVAKTLLCLQAITSGQVLYRDQNIANLHGKNLRLFRKQVQIIFQDPFSSMNPRMMISDILAEGLRAQKISANIIANKQKKVLDQVGLPYKSLTRYPHQFSGGQRQRLCIARALITEPELLICDEPTSALDVSVQAQILNLLKVLQQEYNLAYLFITHNMGVVAYIADEVIVMRQGKVVEIGSCQNIFTQPQSDYTRELLNGVLSV